MQACAFWVLILSCEFVMSVSLKTPKLTSHGMNWRIDHQDLQCHAAKHFLHSVLQTPEPWKRCEKEVDKRAYLWCPICEARYDGPCTIHGPATIITDTLARNGDPMRPFRTLPRGIVIGPSSIPDANFGVWTTIPLPKMVRFGPFEGNVKYNRSEIIATDYSWIISYNGAQFYVDAADMKYANWLRYVNSPNCRKDQNLMPAQYKGVMYYYTFKEIPVGTELLIWYGNEFATQTLHLDPKANC